jgi:hypothetical protein
MKAVKDLAPLELMLGFCGDAGQGKGETQKFGQCSLNN